MMFQHTHYLPIFLKFLPIDTDINAGKVRVLK